MDKPAPRDTPVPPPRPLAETRPQVLIAPIGAFNAELIRPIGQAIEGLFGYPTVTCSLLQDLGFAFDLEREQYYSTLILEKLAATAPAQALKVLAITTVDLFIPILTYVYGEAQLGGRACIISTYRLDEAPPLDQLNDLARARLVKEALHELGHTFKLRHCPDRGCCMHYCRSLRDVDRKSEHLCRHCLVLLRDEIKRLDSSS
jgi:archaemetzincin